MMGSFTSGANQYPDYPDQPDIIVSLLLGLHAIMEDVDPANYARLLFEAPLQVNGVEGPRRNLLLQQAFEEQVVVQKAGALMARHAGLPLLTPSFGDLYDAPKLPGPVSGNLYGVTGVVTQFSPAPHEFLMMNNVADQDPELTWRGQEQAAIFLRIALDTGVGVAIDPYDEEQREQYQP